MSPVYSLINDGKMKLLMDKIFPPAYFKSREGYNVEDDIQNLNPAEKKQLEEELISFSEQNFESGRKIDSYVAETFVTLNSTSALPVLKKYFDHSNDNYWKLLFAIAIYKIGREPSMLTESPELLNCLDDPRDAYYASKVIKGLFYLRDIREPKVLDTIRKYMTHKDSLVRFNAEQAINRM